MNQPNANGHSPLLLSAREAAKLLSISERSLWRFSTPRGEIPVVRLGGRVLYSVRDLETWIAGKTHGRMQ
jgi:predicted DNA-binding transcriptional regulator AlpA